MQEVGPSLNSEPCAFAKQRKHNIILTWVVIFLLCSSAVCTVLAVLHVPVLPRSTPKPLTKIDINPKVLATEDSICLGYPDAKFRIVMFGDYECPPCRASWPQVVSLAKAHPKSLAVYFRNFPLSSIHPRAYSAATAAEVAKAYGRFSAAHDLLYRGLLPEQDYGAFCKAVGISKAEFGKAELKAQKTVGADLNLALGLGLEGTPTFFLIDDSHSVFVAGSVDELRPALKGLD